MVNKPENPMKPSKKFYDNLDFKTTSLTQGCVLISEPLMNDPNFSRSVVLLSQFDEEGVLGFILNHQSTSMVKEVIADFPIDNIPLFIGGPVCMNQVFFVHTLGDKLANSIVVKDSLCIGGDFNEIVHMLKSGEAHPNQVRFFVGYSGWDRNQLSEEIKDNSWIIAPVSDEEVMGSPDSLWENTLKKLGKKFEYLSDFPLDANLN